MNIAFALLYHLENPNLSIFEIKRHGLPENAPASEVYQWFLFNKLSGQLSPLHFRSMDSDGGIEERFFEEGYLKFSQESGTFIEKFNSAQHLLTPTEISTLTGKMAKAIESYYI